MVRFGVQRHEVSVQMQNMKENTREHQLCCVGPCKQNHLTFEDVAEEVPLALHVLLVAQAGEMSPEDHVELVGCTQRRHWCMRGRVSGDGQSHKR